MKRTYQKPALNNIDIVCNQMIAGSISTNEGEYDPNKPILGNGRRGVWGDLWVDDSQE